MVQFNPYLTTNAPGSFNISSAGFIAGTLLDNPPDLFRIAGGVLSQAEPLPMFGGVGISEAVPASVFSATNPVPNLGPVLTRAAALAGLTGFAVFNQAHNGVNFPQSPVPVMGPGNSVNFVRLKSGVRIALPIVASLTSLSGGLVTAPVSWDFVNQQIIPFQAAYAANVLTASSWASTGGGQVTFTTTSAHGVAVGSYFTITGSVPAAYNGTYLALAGTTGSTLIGALAANPGAIVTEGTLSAGGGALPCEILEVDVGNSMVPVYTPATGFVGWNRSGSCAVALLN